VTARNGGEFIDEFFIAHHFERYTSNKYRHPQPPYFFFLVALAGAFPWSFWLASSGRRFATIALRTRKPAADKLNVFLWLWTLVPIVFFSFSGSKLPGYVLPAFPAIAVIVGLELEQWWAAEEPRRMAFLAVATALFIFAIALSVGLRADREIGLKLGDAFTTATIAIVVAVIYLALWFLLSGRAATLFLPFGLALVVIVAANLIFPALGRSQSLREFSLKAVEVARVGERLVFYVNHDHRINFYATDLPLRDDRSELITVASPEIIEGLIRANGGTSMLVASPRRWADGINETSQLKMERLWEHKRIMRCSPGCDWVLLRAELKK
jgi:4-amino-4-deoxy-L-arabinose transferase-like glycosyltransferase